MVSPGSAVTLETLYSAPATDGTDCDRCYRNDSPADVERQTPPATSSRGPEIAFRQLIFCRMWHAEPVTRPLLEPLVART